MNPFTTTSIPALRPVSTHGWSDLAGSSGSQLGHVFPETRQGVRYTLSESARRTVLDRLLALNNQDYEEEVKAGLHDKKAKGKRLKDEGKKNAPSPRSELLPGPLSKQFSLE